MGWFTGGLYGNFLLCFDTAAPMVATYSVHGRPGAATCSVIAAQEPIGYIRRLSGLVVNCTLGHYL